MKNSKRLIFLFILILTMLSVLLVGCSNDGTSNKGNSAISSTLNNEYLTNDFYNALAEINVDVNKVTDFKYDKEYAGGKKYTFSYKTMSGITLCCNEYSTVDSINVGNTQVYSRGYESYNIENYLLSIQEHDNMISRAREIAQSKLNFPSSAKFPYTSDKWNVSKDNNLYLVSSYVEAKNAFGVEGKVYFTIGLYQQDENNVITVYLKMDNNVQLNTINQYVVKQERKKVTPKYPNQGEEIIENGIYLRCGELGEYGEEKMVDGISYIEYKIPYGKYNVSSNSKQAKVFVSSDKMIMIDGYWENDDIITYSFVKGESKEINIPQGYHVEISNYSSVVMVLKESLSDIQQKCTHDFDIWITDKNDKHKEYRICNKCQYKEYRERNIADIEKDEAFDFLLNDNKTYTIVRNKMSDKKEIVVPDSYCGYPVVGIGEGAFQNNGIITKIVIPDSIIEIGCNAFKGCNALVDLTMPFVGESEHAEGIKSVLGYIFGYTTITYGTYKTSDSSFTAQYYYGKYYVYYIPKTLKRVTITKQTNIPAYAFRNCDLIEEINIPENTTSIGEEICYMCESLSMFNAKNKGELNIPIGVKDIPSKAFTNCKQFINILHADDIVSIGNYAFFNCENIQQFNSLNAKEIDIASSVNYIGISAFENNKLIEKILIPNSVTSIGDSAFKGCNALVDLTMPFVGESEHAEGIKSVLGYIFGYTTITYGTYKTSDSSFTAQYYYGKYYVYYIPKTLKKVTITKQTNIPAYAFRNCDLVEEINIPENTTSIGKHAFYCTKINTLDYSGNKLQWNNIKLDIAWNEQSVIKSIHCIDGIIVF